MLILLFVLFDPESQVQQRLAGSLGFEVIRLLEVDADQLVDLFLKQVVAVELPVGKLLD